MTYAGRARAIKENAPFDLPTIPVFTVKDPANEQAEREAVVAEAKTWIRTAYHHRGTLKFKSEEDRGGVDCAHFPYQVYHAVGLLPQLDLGEYPPDWFLHQGAERYLTWVEELTAAAGGGRVVTARSGDFVLYKVGRLYAHGAIIVDPDTLIHALRPAGMVIEEGIGAGDLADREHIFFTLWGR